MNIIMLVNIEKTPTMVPIAENIIGSIIICYYVHYNIFIIVYHEIIILVLLDLSTHILGVFNGGGRIRTGVFIGSDKRPSYKSKPFHPQIYIYGRRSHI